MREQLAIFWKKCIKWTKQAFDFFRIKSQSILHVLLAWLGTCGVLLTLKNIYAGLLASVAFLAVVIFVLLFYLYQKVNKLSKGERVLQLSFTALIALALVLGVQLDMTGEINWHLETLLTVVLLCFTVGPIIGALITSIKNCNLENFAIKNPKRFFWISFALIFVGNFLVFLALFPGVYGYDAGAQILQILDNNVQPTTHFSILYSTIIAMFVNLGQTVFHSAEIGFALYAFSQMVVMDLIATKITLFATRKTQNGLLYLFCLLFFSCFPFFTVATVSSAQDVLFSGVFALLVMDIYRMSDNEDYLKKPINLVSSAFLILILCLLRNNGFYCILLMIPFVIILQKQHRLVVLIGILAPLLIYKIISGPIYSLVGITSTDTIREMASIPSQQLARVYSYNRSAYNEQDLKKLLVYYEGLEGFEIYPYQPMIADPAKRLLNNEATKDDLLGYIELWAKIGLKDPKNYVEAFLMNSLGFWYPGKFYPDSRMYHPPLEYNMMDTERFGDGAYVTIKRKSLLPFYEKLLCKVVSDNAWQKIPVLSLLTSGGTYFWLTCFAVGVIILQKRWKLLMPLSLLVGLYITLFLSPVALMRYYFPIMLLAPVLIGLILCELRLDTTKARP